MRKFIESLVGKDNISVNDRKLIFPYELDVVIPSMKTAFEFNGLYWHKVNAVRHGYHLHKTMRCERLGYALVHVWEDEWERNMDNVKSLIHDVLFCRDNVFSKYADCNGCVDWSKICKTLVPRDMLITELPSSIVKRNAYDIENCGILQCTSAAS